MAMDKELDWYAQRAQEICLEYLQDSRNYPIVDGEAAFIDYESYNEFSAMGRYRPSSHLIESWVVKFWAEKEGVRWIVENTKYVGRMGQYNLLNLLEKGNSEVTIPYWQREQGVSMTYYYRYKTRWYFKKHHRYAMRPIFKKEIGLLIQAAVDYALDEAGRDMMETIGWEP